MSKIRASDDLLGTIHQQLGELYKELSKPYYLPAMNKDGEQIDGPDGEPLFILQRPAPAELAAMNAFLKNNDIVTAPEMSDEVEKLREKMDARRKRRQLPDVGADYGIQ